MRQKLMGYVVIISLLGIVLFPAMTPVSAQSATAVGLAPVTCDAEPRSFDQIAMLAATPVAPASALPADGTTAPSDVTSAIEHTVARAVACANANDVLRSFAFFTDRYLAERFGNDHPDDLGSLDAALSRSPDPAAPVDKLTLSSVNNVVLYDDIIASATIVTENRDVQLTDQLVFIWVDGRWLIDSWTAKVESSDAKDG